MLSRRWIACVLVGAMVLSGCRKSKGKPPYAVTTTTTRQAAEGAEEPPGVVAATQAATRPASSSLMIGERLLTFPRARLFVQDRGPSLVLLLVSDDPRDALSATYSGNRYYLEIKLDIDDVANLATTDWYYKAGSMDRADSPNGIFLEGDRKQLQPHDVSIIFNRAGSQMAMAVSGQFLLFHTRPEEAAPPQAVLVQGTLVAELETPRR